MIPKIKNIALCGFLVFATAVCSQAGCNAPDGTDFTIVSAQISGQTKAYFGMLPVAYTCTIETDPVGYEGELTVTWEGDCDATGKIEFSDDSSKMASAKISGNGCSRQCAPLSVEVGSLKYFAIVTPIDGALVDTQSPVDIKAVAPFSYSELYSVDVEWNCSGGGSGSGFSTTINLNHSHGYSVFISAIASRSTDVVAKMVAVTTLNAELLAEYNRLLTIKNGWIDKIDTAQGEITTKTIEQLEEENKAEQLRAEKEAILDGMRIAEEKTAQFEETVTNVGYTSTGITLVKIVVYIIFPELGTISLTETVVESLTESTVETLVANIYEQAVNDYPQLLLDKNTAISTADANALRIAQEIIQLNSSIITYNENIDIVNEQMKLLAVKVN